MTIPTVTSTEIKSQFGQILEAALGGIPTIVQRYTRPVAVVMGWKQWEDYQSLKKLHSELLAQRRTEPDLDWETVKSEMIRDGVIDG